MNDPGNMIMDKSLRSVFVGNIPYEATEEKLKDNFSEVGQVGNELTINDEKAEVLRRSSREKKLVTYEEEH